MPATLWVCAAALGVQATAALALRHWGKRIAACPVSTMASDGDKEEDGPGRARVRAYHLVVDGASVGGRVAFAPTAAAARLGEDVSEQRVGMLLLGGSLVRVDNERRTTPREPGDPVTFRTAALPDATLAAMPLGALTTLDEEGGIRGLSASKQQRVGLLAWGFRLPDGWEDVPRGD